MKTWTLILIAVNINNPNDIPGRVTIQLPNQQTCEQAQQSLTSYIKFPWFKVEARCEKNLSNN